MSKRFTNEREHFVTDLMGGLALDSSRVTVLDAGPDNNIAVRTAIAERSQSPRVSVVSGGGSGHEPMAASYVGDGMLAAAAVGDIFRAPSVASILCMLTAVAPISTGILVIIMRYDGDILSFGTAVEALKGNCPDLPIETICVQDDEGRPDANVKRGIAGTAFVIKVAGAAADDSRSFQDVVAIAKVAAKSVLTYGVALDPCCIPGQQIDHQRLNRTEMELGMGIHGEAGIRKEELSNIGTAYFALNLMALMCSHLDEALSKRQEISSKCTGFAIMINNLGAVPQSEMLIIANAVAEYIYSDKPKTMKGTVHQAHMFCGTYMTALQMNGISITCFALPFDGGDMKKLLYARTECRSWNAGFALQPPQERKRVANLFASQNPDSRPTAAPTRTVPLPKPDSGSRFGLSSSTEDNLMGITQALLDHSDELEALDQRCGDGDLGNTVRTACARIREDLLAGKYAGTERDPATLLDKIAASVSSSGGSMGNFAAIFLKGAGNCFRRTGQTNFSSWREAFVAGTDAVMERGGANIGDRTLVDALKPAANVLALEKGMLAEAIDAADRGCDDTKSIPHARFGRSQNVRSDMLLTHADPGARLVCIALKAFSGES